MLFWHQDNIGKKINKIKMASYKFGEICSELFYTFPD